MCQLCVNLRPPPLFNINLRASLTEPSLLLAGGLVKPCANTNDLVPFFLEVLVRDNVVVAHHLDWMALQTNSIV